MEAAEGVSRSGDCLDNLIGGSRAMLAVEKIPQRRLRQQFHRGVALRQHIGLELVHLHGRFAEQRVRPQRTLGRAAVIHP